MKEIILLLSLLIFSCSSPHIPHEAIPIIPRPNKLESSKGSLVLNGNVKVSINAEALIPVVENFRSDIIEYIALSEGDAHDAKIKIEWVPADYADESYMLQTTKEGITVRANSLAGIHYALQTLRQLIIFSNSEVNKVVLPILTIHDKPRYNWRGVMLDESRFFFGKEKVKQLLEMMSLHKLNVFHWHLTDDPGWRIEIKQYPKLTTVGGLGHELDPDAPAQYYTQRDIQEIVEFAAARFIQVIPEVDMPGHARAANRAYPQFSGGGSKSHPEFTFNPGKEETYGYLTNILREVTTLFPSQYIHMGGDEVHFGNEKWQSLPEVKELMKREKLDDLKAVETYFVRRMADSIRMLDKTVIGWDEIVDHKLNAHHSVVMWWRHDRVNNLQDALHGGYNVVLCPRIPLYFDFNQHESHQYGRVWKGDYSSLDGVYHFPPDSLAKGASGSSQIKGMQANIWSERIDDAERLDFMTYPRLSALAEAAWTRQESKNFACFEQRLQPMLQYLHSLGIGYFNPFQPHETPEPPSEYGKR